MCPAGAKNGMDASKEEELLENWIKELEQGIQGMTDVTGLPTTVSLSVCKEVCFSLYLCIICVSVCLSLLAYVHVSGQSEVLTQDFGKGHQQ